MRIVCIDVVIEVEIYRTSALHELRRALRVATVAHLTLDARLVTVANRRLAAAAANWLFIERSFGSPKNEPHK
jgi:hypothetical protein